uniref:Uncharacterized protein n=1 Tax=Parascaris univalens TaxID=6257 RepID=A0A914ZKE0_PARUN
MAKRQTLGTERHHQYPPLASSHLLLRLPFAYALKSSDIIKRIKIEKNY